MCIIIAHNKDAIIEKQNLLNAFENNNDGAGIAWHVDNKLKLYKSIGKFKNYYEKYKEAIQETDDNILLHMRIQTHGDISLKNCHPFYIRDGSDGKGTPLVLAHNGILSDYSYKEVQKLSDTQKFINKILKKLRRNFENDSSVIILLNAYAKAENSKFVLLNSKGKLTICNKEAGITKDGVWYSNTSYNKKMPIDNYDYSNHYYTSGYAETYNANVNKHNRATTTTNYCCKFCGLSLHCQESIDRLICIRCVKELNFNEMDLAIFCVQCGVMLKDIPEQYAETCSICDPQLVNACTYE